METAVDTAKPEVTGDLQDKIKEEIKDEVKKEESKDLEKSEGEGETPGGKEEKAAPVDNVVKAEPVDGETATPIGNGETTATEGKKEAEETTDKGGGVGKKKQWNKDNKRKPPKRFLRIRVKGLPIDNYVKDIKKLHKLVNELFVGELGLRVPTVKPPTWGDKWLYMEMKTPEDKAKALDELDGISWKEYQIQALDCASGNKNLPRLYTDEETPVTHENVFSFFLQYQDMPYKHQLEMKTKRTLDALSDLLDSLMDANVRLSNFLNQHQPIVEETIPSVLIDGYSIDNYFYIERNKETGQIEVGLKIFNHGASVILPVNRCINIPRPMINVAETFGRTLEEFGLTVGKGTDGDIVGVGLQMNSIGQIILTAHVMSEGTPDWMGDQRKKNHKFASKRGNKQSSSTEEKKEGDEKPMETESGTLTKSEEENEVEKSEDKVEETVVGDGEVEKTKLDGEKETAKSDADKEADKVKTDGEADMAKTDGEADKAKTDGEVEKSSDGGVEEPMNGKVEEPVDGEGDKAVDGDDKSEEKPVEGEAEKAADGVSTNQEEEQAEKQARAEKTDKEVRNALMEFYKKYGTALGIESIYYKYCYFINRKEVGVRNQEFIRVVGPTCLTEHLGGVAFMVGPERIWAPTMRGFESIISVLTRLGRIALHTTVITVATDHRYLPLYLSKLAKEVIALGCWNHQSAQTAKRIADAKGCRNVEFYNMTGKLPTSIYRLQGNHVVIFWDNADSNVLNKLLNAGLYNIIDVMTSEKRFNKNLFKHIAAEGTRMVPGVIVPVDTHPHTDRYAIVVKYMQPEFGKRKKPLNAPPPVPLLQQPIQPPFKRSRPFGLPQPPPFLPPPSVASLTHNTGGEALKRGRGVVPLLKLDTLGVSATQRRKKRRHQEQSQVQPWSFNAWESGSSHPPVWGTSGSNFSPNFMPNSSTFSSNYSSSNYSYRR